MIRLANISYSYPDGAAALHGISLEVPAGAVFGLVGANGSGKSSLLAVLSGLYSPGGGSGQVADIPLPGSEKRVRQTCRLVMQDADLQILGATVEEDLLLGRSTDPATVESARNQAARFGLADHWDRPVHTLSWGMKRKLCLASAMLDAPRVLLLDEPFSGLDYPAIGEMRAILRENRERGLTQVVAAHDLECFLDLADGLAVLDGGRLAASGSPADVVGVLARHKVRPPCSWLAQGTIDPWEGS